MQDYIRSLRAILSCLSSVLYVTRQGVQLYRATYTNHGEVDLDDHIDEAAATAKEVIVNAQPVLEHLEKSMDETSHSGTEISETELIGLASMLANMKIEDK